MKVELPEASDYCAKCGAPLGKGRFNRRRAWLVTLSPDLNSHRKYELCLNCIMRIEAWVERRAEGRIVIRKEKKEELTKVSYCQRCKKRVTTAWARVRVG